MSVCIGFNEALYLVLACAFTLGWIGRNTLYSIKKWWDGLNMWRRHEYVDRIIFASTGVFVFGLGAVTMWLVVV